jgi:hypothetical protein
MLTKGNDNTTTRGREAEERAARHLERCGQRVVERNFRVRGGEIDLICRDGKTLVFVEVRLRGRGEHHRRQTPAHRPRCAALSGGQGGLRLPLRLRADRWRPTRMDPRCVCC